MDEDFEPSIRTLGISAYFRYALLACGIFCTLFLLVDTFSFFNFPVLLLKIISSLVTTMACVMCADSMWRK